MVGGEICDVDSWECIALQISFETGGYIDLDSMNMTLLDSIEALGSVFEAMVKSLVGWKMKTWLVDRCCWVSRVSTDGCVEAL